MKKLFVCLALGVLAFDAIAFGQSEASTIAHRSLGNGSRYAFQDSRGEEWLYAENSNGGYDVYDGQHSKVATVTATFE